MRRRSIMDYKKKYVKELQELDGEALEMKRKELEPIDFCGRTVQVNVIDQILNERVKK